MNNETSQNPAPMRRLVGRVLLGVREYAEGMGVLVESVDGRLVITAYNEAGFNRTQVDLLDLIECIRRNAPELLEAPS